MERSLARELSGVSAAPGVPIQRKCDACEDEEQTLQRKALSPAGDGVPPLVGAQLRSGGRPLDDGLRADLEPYFGHDLSQVRVHTDERADASARSVNALAFTVGHDVVFRTGMYAPHSTVGRRLLAHELTHVVQQSTSSGRAGLPSGVVDPHHASEHEADRVAEQVTAAPRWSSAGPPPARKLTTGAPAGPATVQRTPALGVQVPEVDDPKSVPEAETEYDYQWQSEELAATIYDSPKTAGNERLNSLRQFLYIQKEAELHNRYGLTGDDISDEKAMEIAAAEAAEVQTQIDDTQAVITSKNEQLATNTAQLEQVKKDLKAAIAHRKSALKKDKQAREILATRAAQQKQIDRQNTRIAAADGNLAWAEKRKAKMGEAKYTEQTTYWGKVKSKAEEKKQAAETIVESTQADYDRLIAPLQDAIDRLGEQQKQIEADNKVLKGEIREEKASLKALTSELKNIHKVAAGDSKALLTWKLQRFTRQLEGMDHAQLLKEIKTLFEQDDGTRFPDWMRYAVIHLSGMRYASAHNSWYSPQRLLQILKGAEIAEAAPEVRSGMMAQGQALLDEHPDMAGLGLKQAQKKGLKATSGDAITRKLKAADVPIYVEIQQIEARLNELYLGLQQLGSQPAEAQRVQDAIAAEEQNLEMEEGKLTEAGLKAVRSARKKRQALLLTVYEKDARRKLGVLNDKQAIGLLKQMKDAGQIPDVVWQELTAFTGLRLESEDSSWEAAKKHRGLKDAVGATPEEQAKLDAWRQILNKKTFYKDSTGWRAEHGRTLSPSLTTSLVCDQLGSYLQHLRGHVRPGGLRNNAMYYLAQEQKGTPGAFLKRPTSVSDLPSGASLYWIRWSDVSIEPEYVKAWKAHKSLADRLSYLEKKKTDTETERDKTKRKSQDYVLSERQRAKLDVRIAGYDKDITKLKGEVATSQKALDGMRVYKPEADKLPDISNMVSPMGPAGSAMSFDRFDEETGGVKPGQAWQYQTSTQIVNKREVVTIMRAMLNPYDCRDPATTAGCTIEFSTTPNAKVVKQWLKFVHEATIMYSDDTFTVTFDTGTKFNDQDVKGMGARQRYTKSLLNNPQVLVGYAPGATPNVPVSPYLKGYMDKLDENKPDKK